MAGIVVAIAGMGASAVVMSRIARVPLARWVLVPIVGYASVFLWAGTISAAVSYYVLGISEATINAGEGLFVVLFWVVLIPVVIAHLILVWLNWW